MLKEKILIILICLSSFSLFSSITYAANIEEQTSKIQKEALGNANLEVLAIENILLNTPFEPSHTNYEIEVPHYIENLNIFVAPEDENAKVEIIGKDNLKEGNNVITIKVKSQSGFTEKVYTINATKRSQAEEKEHEKKQLKQKEKLENAYELEKTSAKINIDNIHFSKTKVVEKQNSTKWSIVVVGIITAMFI